MDSISRAELHVLVKDLQERVRSLENSIKPGENYSVDEYGGAITTYDDKEKQFKKECIAKKW